MSSRALSNLVVAQVRCRACRPLIRHAENTTEQKDPGIAQYLLADPAVLAIVQIAVGVFALFFAVSFPVHV